MLLIGNWKTYVESRTKAKALYAAAKRLAARGHHEVGVAPPLPYIGMLTPTRPGKRAPKLVAQDIFVLDGAVQTGAVSVAMLRDAGVTHAIIGHSERRAQGESNERVAHKVQHASTQGLIPILCVGELARDADAAYLAVIREQIESAYQSVEPKFRHAIIIAYEPVWAIGTGAVITPDDLAEMVLYIRKVLAGVLSEDAAHTVQVLYGGSVDAGNVRNLSEGTGIAGFLVGRASSEVASFSALVQAAPRSHA